ncbi:hypothetical protein [Cohnella soli]|uniref:Phage protein n=1 Tax=Cohnella soli TaxID=425005 RepID=A0ABW0HP77_9BACL
MKSAEEMKQEFREKWMALIAIYAESVDAFFDEEINDNDIMQELQKAAELNQPISFAIGRDIVTHWMTKHCFKEGFFRTKQVRHTEFKLNMEPKSWPFPDNPDNNYLVYILEKSKAYQACKNRYIANGYDYNEKINPGGVVVSIGLKQDKLF